MLFDKVVYLTYLINPALIVNEVWLPYMAIYFGLVGGLCVTSALIIIGLHNEYLRKDCAVFRIVLKVLVQLYATVLLIPCFSMDTS